MITSLSGELLIKTPTIKSQYTCISNSEQNKNFSSLTAVHVYPYGHINLREIFNIKANFGEEQLCFFKP